MNRKYPTNSISILWLLMASEETIMENMIDTIQLSGDAYYYLLNGEEPLDPDNLEEADEIAERYKYGIKFLGEPEPIDGTDMVETKISIPAAIKLAEDNVVIFTLLPDKLCKVKVENNYSSTVSLEPIGDKYWAEYFNSGYGTRYLLPICKISDYEKWFGLKPKNQSSVLSLAIS